MFRLGSHEAIVSLKEHLMVYAEDNHIVVHLLRLQ